LPKKTASLRDLGKEQFLFSIKQIFRPPPAATDPSPEKLPVEPPEIVTLRAMSTDRALWRVANRDLEIGTVIDIGASDGRWSGVCAKHYPDAHYLLIEAQDLHEEALKAYVSAHPKAQYVLAAAGDACGEIYFDDSDLFTGFASKIRSEGARKVVRQTTIDHEIGASSLPGPYMIKLDTHGYEVPILCGATEILRNTNLLVIETYNFRLIESCLLFHEIIAYMRERGFGVVDMSEPHWRVLDFAFWQIDLFFVRLDRPEFLVNTYR
jgi:FkbM family methyltransferase